MGRALFLVLIISLTSVAIAQSYDDKPTRFISFLKSLGLLLLYVLLPICAFIIFLFCLQWHAQKRRNEAIYRMSDLERNQVRGFDNRNYSSDDDPPPKYRRPQDLKFNVGSPESETSSGTRKWPPNPQTPRKVSVNPNTEILPSIRSFQKEEAIQTFCSTPSTSTSIVQCVDELIISTNDSVVRENSSEFTASTKQQEEAETEINKANFSQKVDEVLTEIESARNPENANEQKALNLEMKMKKMTTVEMLEMETMELLHTANSESAEKQSAILEKVCGLIDDASQNKALSEFLEAKYTKMKDTQKEMTQQEEGNLMMMLERCRI